MSDLIWYDSTETGASVLNNVAGSMITVVKSCLVTGFNQKTVTSISVTSNVATVNCVGHGFTTAFRKVVQIDGCDEPLLNGLIQPTSTLLDSFTFSSSGVADGIYYGTITAKRPGLGWVESFTGANKSIFGRTDITATTNLIRIDNTRVAPALTVASHVCMVETATGIDTYTNKAPSNDSFCLWSTGENTATAKPWAIVGDSKRFFFMVPGASPTSYGGFHVYFFGDPEQLKASDVNGCLMTNHSSINMSTTPSGFVSDYPSNLSGAFQTAGAGYTFFAGKYDGTVKPYPARWLNVAPNFVVTYPSAVTQPIVLIGPIFVTDQESVRGRLPVYVAASYQPHNHLNIVQPENETKRFLVIDTTGGATAAANTLRYYISLEGWT